MLRTKEKLMQFRHLIRLFTCAVILAIAPAAFSQESEKAAAREKTRERLNALLQRLGPEMNVSFKPSSKSHFVFMGVLREGLKNAEQFEIVISVSTSDNIGFRIFPH